MNENNNDDWVLSIINAANNNMKNEYTNSPMINNMVSDTFSQPQMPSQRPLSYSSPTQSSPQQQSASPQQQTDSVIQKSSIAQMIAPYAADYEKYFGEETRRDPHYNMLLKSHCFATLHTPEKSTQNRIIQRLTTNMSSVIQCNLL